MKKKILSLLATGLVVLASTTMSAASAIWIIYHPKPPKSLLK